MVVASPLFITHRERLAELASEHRLPAMFGSKENVQAGGLISYSADLTDLHRRKTAKALGLTVPPSLIARADEVIE